MANDTWIIAGLGNPGDKYAYTWHNCGFLAMELLADKCGISMDRTKFDGLYGKGKYKGKDVILLKPQTFMNNSGMSIAPMANFFKVDPSHVIVIYDDIDIAIGSIRVRTKGSAGTHNGMKSIIKCMGTQDFPRVRVGTGPVPEKWALIDYVLADIPKDIRPKVYESFEMAADAALKYIENDGQIN